MWWPSTVTPWNLQSGFRAGLVGIDSYAFSPYLNVSALSSLLP